MDLSNFNLATVLMIAMAIIIAYVGIKFFTNIVWKIVCFTIGTILLVFVLTQFGITIPIISDLVSYFFDALKVVLENLQELFSKVQK